MSAIKAGDEVYVRDPRRFEPGCECIIGLVEVIEGDQVTLNADVGKIGGGYKKRITIPHKDVSLRGAGVPITQLSGRPGRPGFSEFCRIAASWGYD